MTRMTASISPTTQQTHLLIALSLFTGVDFGMSNGQYFGQQYRVTGAYFEIAEFYLENLK
tara:strand:- start:50 stop:229 length:180 start_codon:yes stop_codon:yes gene_type:complete